MNLIKPRNLGVLPAAVRFFLGRPFPRSLALFQGVSVESMGIDKRDEHLNGFLAIVLRLVKGRQAKGFVCILEIPEGNGFLRIPCCERRAT